MFFCSRMNYFTDIVYAPLFILYVPIIFTFCDVNVPID